MKELTIAVKYLEKNNGKHIKSQILQDTRKVLSDLAVPVGVLITDFRNLNFVSLKVHKHACLRF